MTPFPGNGTPAALFSARPMGHQSRAEMCGAFERAIRLAEHDRLRLRVPHEVKPTQRLKSMHYHYRPEVFLQLHGTTEFQFPRETFELGPDEICVIPAGVPHGEKVRAEATQPFRNLVAGFYNNTISLHFAFEARPQHPDIAEIEFFDAPNLDVFLTLTNNLAHAQAMQTPARAAVRKGLLLALLGLFRNIVETGGDRLNTDIGKVFQAKCIVREQFANPELGVQQIAAALGCSRDYLSHLFHAETKERLTHYIQRIRIDGATLALETTVLNISEIAYASGFSDPAYFGRVFKQHKGVTPQEFRARLDAQRSRPESTPKTVYADRVDFSPGAPTGQRTEAAVAAGR
ncbi:MAG TPA: helix-turn-helix domain-containing protein [Opitutaceae bacterium]|nr:helix-turn-helix domain-containing protein [Opitutaceae bacterium]